MKTRRWLLAPALLAPFLLCTILSACAEPDTAGGDAPDCGGITCPADSACNVPWSYTGQTGPACWTCLSSCYAECDGRTQSPVNLAGARAHDLDTLALSYETAWGTAENTGHSIQVNIEGGTLAVGGVAYDLDQFHFHLPGEHTDRDSAYAAEIHLVHEDANGAGAVLGIFVEAGAENAFMQQLEPLLPDSTGGGGSDSLDVGELLPEALRYYTYGDSLATSPFNITRGGSLTTPECDAGIRWMVLTTPVTFSQEQLDLLMGYFPDGTARPVQPLYDRVVYVSTPTP